MLDKLETMKKVLLEESEAIENLANTLDDTYIQLIDMCVECKGKIILVGMGKSGHIARKISATLASLGMPSFFLHPAEAAHGDLGMVEKRDLVIMLSKSGETDEMIQLLNSLKIIACNLVGIFCEKKSTLERYCDLTIILPMEKEACINNLAPTTSTTLMLAFGDALAVTLSNIKAFGRQDFALFHPRGMLGKQLLLTVSELANNNVKEIAVRENDEIRNILWVITRNRLGAVAVMGEHEKLIGLVSDGDIRRALEKNVNIMKMQAYEIMTTTPISVEDKVLAVDAFKIMQEKKISVLPVVDDKNAIRGMVSFHNIVESGIAGGK